MRYRVTHRSAAARAGLTQMLGGNMISFATLLLATNAIAASCPATITDKQNIVAPSHQEVHVDQHPRHLEMMRVYSDRPETRLQLVPDHQTHKNKTVWDFGPRGTSVWIECTYKRSAVSLRQYVPNARRCTFVHNSNSGGDKRKGHCKRVAP